MLVLRVNFDLCEECGYCGMWFADLPYTAYNGLYLPDWIENDKDIKEIIFNLPTHCMYKALTIEEY